MPEATGARGPGSQYTIKPGSYPWLFWKVTSEADCELPRISARFPMANDLWGSVVRDIQTGDWLTEGKSIQIGDKRTIPEPNLILRPVGQATEPQILTIAGPGRLDGSHALVLAEGGVT